jgi:hypoxanthine phosphoribosyltransferase
LKASCSNSESEVGEVLFSAEALGRRVAELGNEITLAYRNDPPLVIAVLKNATVFACDLIRNIDLPVQVDFLAITRFKKEQPARGVRILKDIDQDISGKSILMVQDIVDTGFTTNYLLKNLKARHPGELAVCALLDRRSIRIIDVPVEYRGFTVGEDYVVGYGLDYRDRYGNLPYIARLQVTSAAAEG